MDFKNLFEIQRDLDIRIRNNNNLMGRNLTREKILALQVELGELANETRCFKFWSTKDSSPKAVVLEEFVDCLHFILSIGIDMEVEDIIIGTEGKPQSKVAAFQEVFLSITKLVNNHDRESYTYVFNSLVSLGEVLGFKWEEIVETYLYKNRVNHQRQIEGY